MYQNINFITIYLDHGVMPGENYGNQSVALPWVRHRRCGINKKTVVCILKKIKLYSDLI